MAPSVGSEGSERADMARVRPGGLALLPWTRQMLTVLWAQIRLLLQVIYYSCMSGRASIRKARLEGFIHIYVSIIDLNADVANPKDQSSFVSEHYYMRTC